MEDFIGILKSNNTKKLKDFLLKNSKKPKPISPFVFEKKIFDKEEDKNGNRKHERINE